MILEGLVKTAKGRLTWAEREMRKENLTGCLEPLRDAHDAVFSLSHLATYREGEYVPLETTYSLRNAGVHIGGESQRELSKDERDYLEENGFTGEGLLYDANTIRSYHEAVKLAGNGLFLDVKERAKPSNNEGGLQRPLIAPDALNSVVGYAWERGEQGLQHYINIAEGLVREGVVNQPVDDLSVEELVYDKIIAYARELKAFSVHGKVGKILRRDAKNRALDRIRVLREESPRDGSWVYQQIQEGKKFAEQAGLGLLYQLRLSRAGKVAEEKLSLSFTV